MIARNHWRWSLAAWLGTAAGAAALGAPIPFGVVLGHAPLAASAGLGPDLDKPPARGKPGATAAEAHGPLSNALARLVHNTHGGHRGLTHRYRYAVLAGAAVAVAAWLWPPAVAVLCAWWGAWPLYCEMPRSSRWMAAAVAPALSFVAWQLGVLPASPLAGAAVAVGWSGHIVADRLQSRCFAIGGPVEKVVALGALGAASWAAWALIPR